MWKGYEYSLCDYALAGLKVLEERGKYYPKHIKYFKKQQKLYSNTGWPIWTKNLKRFIHEYFEKVIYLRRPTADCLL